MNDNDIKIVHIASGDLWAGAEVQLYTLVTQLSTVENTHIHVILLNHGTLEEKLRAKDIPITVLDEASLNGLSILRQMISTVAEIQPNIIHTHRIKENIFGSIAARINSNIPSLRTAHGAPEHKPDGVQIAKRLILFLDWFCARFLQKKIIAVSQDLADILKTSYPEKKITVIENGIDIKSFSQAEQRDSDSRKGNAPLRIAIAGRLSPVKRIDIFIQTAQKLKQNHPELNLNFHIYGEGPLRGELEALSHQLKTNGFVHFEGHCSDIKAAFEKTDLLLMTSDHEGLPMILLEAMATRTPIVAHAVGGIPNLLNNGNCGILIKENKPESYATAISELALFPEQRAKIAQQAFIRLTGHYSAKQNAESYLKVYRDLALSSLSS